MSSLAEAYGIKQEMKNISCLLLRKNFLIEQKQNEEHLKIPDVLNDSFL